MYKFPFVSSQLLGILTVMGKIHGKSLAAMGYFQ